MLIRCERCGRRLREASPVCALHGPATAPAPAEEASPVGEPMPPPVLEGHRIERILGQGGFGTVYRAERISDGRPVAIKVARPENGAAVASLRREVVALRKVGAPAVPEVIESGDLPDGAPYLVLELVAAPTLSSVLEDTQGPWPLDRAGPLALALVSSVAAAHERGLVHRDIKPENFFVGGTPTEPVVRLFDFGLVADVGEIPGPNAAGEGTPEYMAPEQDAANLPFSPSADVYSLGILLYEILTGAPPFWGTAAEAREGHRSRRPPLFARACGLPQGIEDVVMRSLAKDRERRPADARQLHGALTLALAERRPESAPIPAAAPASPAAKPAAAAPRADSRPLGLLFFKPREGRSVGAPDLKRLGGDLASASPALGVVAAFGHEAGENPVRLALQAAERLIEQGFASRVLVDAFAVTVQVRPNGARRYLSPAFAKAERFPQADDGDGVLVTASALELLPGTESEPLSTRQDRFRIVPADKRELTVVGAAPTGVIGRDRELGTLLSLAQKALSARTPTVAMVVADAGFGKSEIASALVARLPVALPHAALFALRCQDGVDGSQSRSLRELIRWSLDLAREQTTVGNPNEELARRLGDAGAALWPVVAFALGRLPADAPELRELMAAPGALRSALARAVGEAVRQRARKGPVLIVLDDAHLADATTLDALEYAALEEAGCPIWVCLLARPALLTGRAEVGTRAAQNARVDLGPLEQEASVALARVLLAPVENVPVAALRKLAERTRGNPQLLVELIRGLKRDGAVRQSSRGDWSLATDEIDKLPDLPMVQWVATREVEALPPELAAHARLAALLGSELEEQELDGVLMLAEREGRPLDTQLDAAVGLRRLVDAGVLVRHRNGRYSFRYGVLRDATYNMVPEDRRRDVHDVAFRFYETTETQRPELRLPKLAFHAARAGRKDAAAQLYLDLGLRSQDRHSYVEAEGLFTNARAQLEGTQDARLVAIMRGQGLMRFRQGRYEPALASFQEALAHARALSDRENEVDVLYELATAYDFLYDFQKSKESLEEADRVELPHRPEPLELRLLYGRGRVMYRFGQIAESIAPLFEVIERAKPLGNEAYETRVEAMALVATALAIQSRLDESERLFEQLLELCDQHGDALHVTAALNNRAFVWLPRGDFARLREDFERALTISRENAFPMQECLLLHNLGEVAYLQGDLAAADRHVLKAIALGERLSGYSPYYLLMERLLRARIRIAGGDVAEARTHLEELRKFLAELRARGEAFEIIASDQILYDIVELATRDATDSEWDAVLERSRQVSVQQEPLEVYAFRALAARRAGRVDVARDALTKALELAKTIPNCFSPQLEKWLAELPSSAAA